MTTYNKLDLSRIQIFELMCDYFNQRELIELCFYLRINHELLDRQTYGDFARELIMYMERHGRLSELVQEIAKHRPDIAINKLKSTSHIEEIKEADILLREVLSICSRRAIYTRMHAQLDHQAMFSSLSSCRSDLQHILFKITLEDDRQLVADIISQIDLIERNKENVNIINEAKLTIIQSLIKLSESAKITYTLPRSITEDIFLLLRMLTNLRRKWNLLLQTYDFRFAIS